MRRHREDREEEIEKTFQTSVSELQTSILVALYNFQSYPNQNYPSTVQLIQIIQSSFSHNINIYIYIFMVLPIPPSFISTFLSIEIHNCLCIFIHDQPANQSAAMQSSVAVKYR